MENAWQKHEDSNNGSVEVQEVLTQAMETIFEWMFQYFYDDLKNIQIQMSGGMQAHFDNYVALDPHGWFD